MGKYQGNMPGGAQANPARPVHEGDAASYNLATATNEIVRKLPPAPRRLLQQEVTKLRREDVKEESIRTFVEQTIRLYREKAA